MSRNKNPQAPNSRFTHSLTPTRPSPGGIRPSAFALTIAAAITAHAHADEVKELPTAKAQTQTEDSYKVDKSTSFKHTQPLLDTGKTISVIPQAVMKDRGVENLRDALRNVSGITLAAGEGGAPPGDSMTIRGFSASSDIFVDGVRDIAGYSRDTYNVDSVEVAKGPASAINGRGSTGGSINLLTKAASLEDATDIGLRIGSEGDYRATVDSNVKLGESSAVRVNILTEDGEVAGRDEVENSKNAIAGSFTHGMGTPSRITVSGEYQKQDNLPDYGMPWVSNSSSSDPVAELAGYEGKAPPVDFSNFYGNVYRDYEEIEAQSFTVKYEYDLSPGTTLRAHGRVGSVARETIVTAPRFMDLSTSTDVRLSDEKTRDTKNSLEIFQLDLIGKYLTGDVTHDVVAGLEISSETFERWNLVDIVDDNLDSTPELIDLYNPDNHVEFTGRYGRDGTSTEAVGDTLAFYLFDTITLNEHWEIGAGVRSDSFETDYRYDYSDPGLRVTTSDDLLSWNFAVVYKPKPNGSIYFGAGNSFNPTAESLTVSTRSNSNLKDLDPEETTSFELGTKWELLDGNLLFQSALFLSEKSNALTDDPDFNGDESGYDTLSGEQQIQGLELNATGQLNDAWSLIASYTYQDSEITNAEGDDVEQIGQPLPRTPKHSFSVWSRYDFNSQWSGGVGAQYIGDRTNNATPSSAETADSYTTIDAMLGYQLSSQLSFQLNATNLSDEEYEDQLGGGHFIPGQGRYIRVSAVYSF